MMLLQLLYHNGTRKEIHVVTVWGDHTHGMNRLYYETMYDEPGKGTFLKLEELRTWRTIYKPLPSHQLKL